MRYFDVAAALAVAALASLSSCGYLPSEMAVPGARKSGPGPHARIVTHRQTVNCGTPARGFRRVTFDDIYTTTGDPDIPFVEKKSAPAQFDITAYVWGSDNCSKTGRCSGGDHYWLIERGPGDDFSTWVVTPQYPRITIHSSCRGQLKVGRRYRFSFSRGELVGFSR